MYASRRAKIPICCALTCFLTEILRQRLLNPKISDTAERQSRSSTTQHVAMQTRNVFWTILGALLFAKVLQGICSTQDSSETSSLLHSQKGTCTVLFVLHGMCDFCAKILDWCGGVDAFQKCGSSVLQESVLARAFSRE